MTNGHHHKREMLTITKKGNLLSCHIYFLWRPGELDCHVAAPASLPRLVADLIIKNKVIKIIKIVKIIKNLIINNKVVKIIKIVKIIKNLIIKNK